STDLGSIKAPQEGRIRVFSTLNAPFTFAISLAIGIVFAISMRRRAAGMALFLLPVCVALALTFVRSAWLSLAVGLLVLAAAARGRAAGRTVAAIMVCLGAVVLIGGSNP